MLCHRKLHAYTAHLVVYCVMHIQILKPDLKTLKILLPSKQQTMSPLLHLPQKVSQKSQLMTEAGLNFQK